MTDYFVVHGSTGEYSDRHEWNVAIVETEEAAQRYVIALTQQYQTIPPHMMEDRWDYEKEMEEIMSLDPSFSCDYTGTHYFYGRVQFVPTAELDQKLQPLKVE